MLEIDQTDEDTGGTVFRDVIMLALAGMVDATPMLNNLVHGSEAK